MGRLYRSLAEMKAICEQNGSYYFESDTVKFWGSKVHDPANRWGLFVESTDNFSRTKKLYYVKFFAPSGEVETIEPAEIGKTYKHFPTLAAARRFRDKLTAALDAQTCYRERAVLESLKTIREEGLNTGVYELRNEQGETIKVNVNNFSRFICG